MLQGKKTWIGIVLMLLGFLGLGDITNYDQLSDATDATLKVIGIVVTIYGNWDAHRRLKKLE